MLVSEIFTSIEGEGIRTGYPVTFVRLYGCNLRCSYCDSLYSCDGKEYSQMSIASIVDAVENAGIPRVTISGGEPLIHKNVLTLVFALTNRGYEVNIETNGSVDFMKYLSMPDVIITADYKALSSGVNDAMRTDLIKYLRPTDVLKCVVGSIEDLDDFVRVCKETNPVCNIFLSPVFGKIEPVEIVEYVKAKGLNEMRVQLQLHKIIWEPTKRGV